MLAVNPHKVESGRTNDFRGHRIGRRRTARLMRENKLVARQKVLADAWKSVQAGSYADDKAFEQAWMKARADALTKAGFDPVLTSW